MPKKKSKKALKAQRARARRKRTIRTAAETIALLAVLLVCAVLWRATSHPAAPASAPTASPTIAATGTDAPTAAPEVTAAPTTEPTATPTQAPTPTPEPTSVSITLTAVGDCTIGGDMNGSSEERFADMVSDGAGGIDYDYCFKNVKSIFESDDITLVNLEVVLTDSSNYLKRDDKIFIMRGRPDYVNMLTGSSVEVCNIANNHMTDFGDWGIDETEKLLDENGLGYCGYGRTYLTEVKGVKLGFVGVNYWTTKEDEMRQTITDMREKCDILIVSMHWGNELAEYPTDYQEKWGHIAVDLGADVVIGHHPHVVQGIENYKGVNIVYSLGNFCFGGKKNPTDKDTFIYQTTFTVSPDGQLESTDFTVIPCKITSVADESSNNYQPTPVTDEKEAKKILEKIEYRSRKLDNPVRLTED